MTSYNVLEKGTIIGQLYHRKIRSRAMPVIVGFHSQIGVPRYVPGTGWSVPCDVVGLGSKKAKLVKVRFHPSLVELETIDTTITDIAVRDAIKYLDVLLEDSEWSRNEVVKTCDHRVFHLDRIMHFLSVRQPALSVTCRSLDLNWSLHSGLLCQTLDKLLSDVRYSLRVNSIATSIVAKIQQMSDGDGQKVEIAFESVDMVRPLLRLYLPKDSSYLQIGTLSGCWQQCRHRNTLRLSLPRSKIQSEGLLDVPNAVNLVVVDREKEIPITMENCQLRVVELRRRLDESLAAFQRSASSQNIQNRALHIVRQNCTETLIEISDPGQRARLDNVLSASPLNVICSSSHTDSIDDVASSPDSTDSGIVISPQSSPYMNDAQSSPIYDYSMQNRSRIRPRSASESTGWDGVVLKSILKKPQRIDRFSRSISESQHCRIDLSPLSLLVEPMTEVDESDNHTDYEGPTLSRQKKRVSFSEKVQERRFRSSQSILTAAKKNEKKRAQRKKKQERQRSASESNDESSSITNDPYHCQFDEIADMPRLRSEREDSGFIDCEENDCGCDGVNSAISTNEAALTSSNCWEKIKSCKREVLTQ